MEVPGEEDDDDRHGGGSRDRQLVGEGSLTGRIRRAWPLFTKVLVANRGEIAIRDLPHAARARDRRRSPSTRRPTAARCTSRSPTRRTCSARARRPRATSSQERILDAAQRAGAEAIHPGYGFLAENAAFARAVEAAGLVWIGPPPEAIEAMGSKIAARERMQAAGVPDHPRARPSRSSPPRRSVALGDELGWPIAIKASAGGGGKGLKVVALAGRGRARVRVRPPRGRGVLLRRDRLRRALPRGPAPRRGAGARRRARQRRSTSASATARSSAATRSSSRRRRRPRSTTELRERIGAIAVDAARAVGYRSARARSRACSRREGEYFFLEMNTRIQVEHTVTELVTGLDLVREQVLIAAGEPLSLRQEDVRLTGHAIECRINAEDPSTGFLPDARDGSRATASRRARACASTRASTRGSEVVGLYDPLIAKLIVHGRRPRARAAPDAARARRVRDRRRDDAARLPPGAARAPVLRRRARRATASSSRSELAERAERVVSSDNKRSRGVGRRGSASASSHVEVDGRRFEVTLLAPEPPYAELARRRRERVAAAAATAARRATRSSARCRARCSRSRSPRATRSRPGQVSASSRR